MPVGHICKRKLLRASIQHRRMKSSCIPPQSSGLEVSQLINRDKNLVYLIGFLFGCVSSLVTNKLMVSIYSCIDKLCTRRCPTFG